MRSFELKNGFGFENLSLVERDRPELQPGEVLVRMKAASLNYRDLLVISGAYNPKLRLPLIPVSDGAGIIEAIGAAVKDYEIGDEVIPLFNQSWISGPPTLDRLSSSLGSPLDGVLADYRVFKAKGLIRKPDHLSLAEAATLPCAAVTAWTTLTTEAGVKAGDVVVLQGTGGVSIFALQFAKSLGAEVIIISSSDQKLHRAKDLGADHCINYKTTPDWSKTVRDLTQGRGADCIVEVGGAGTLQQSLKCIRFGGFIGLIGVLSGVETKVSLTHILMQHVRLQGITVGNRDDFEAMIRAMILHDIHPVIDDRRFAFEELPKALMHMASAKHFGKIVLDY